MYSKSYFEYVLYLKLYGNISFSCIFIENIIVKWIPNLIICRFRDLCTNNITSPGDSF